MLINLRDCFCMINFAFTYIYFFLNSIGKGRLELTFEKDPRSPAGSKPQKYEFLVGLVRDSNTVENRR